MQILAAVVLAIPVLIHVYIWTAESLTWRRESTWRRFGLTSQQDADTTAPMALNQGYYNLFLAAVLGTGIVLWLTGQWQFGLPLILAGAGSMVLAALVLVVSNPKLARAAALQGVLPLVGIVLALVA